MVGVGQFANGVARRSRTRPPSHGLRRVRGVVAGTMIALIFILWIVARVAGHL